MFNKSTDGKKKIIAHIIYDVKHGVHHKARLVANDHLTEIKLDIIYSEIFLYVV